MLCQVRCFRLQGDCHHSTPGSWRAMGFPLSHNKHPIPNGHETVFMSTACDRHADAQSSTVGSDQPIMGMLSATARWSISDTATDPS